MAKVPLIVDMTREEAEKLQAFAERKKAQSNPERKKLKPVVKKDSLVRTKKSLGQKFAEAFISEDIKDVRSYIVLDVVVPTIKETILNVGEMIMFGTFGGRRGSRERYNDRVSYSSYYKSDYGRRSSDSRSSRRRSERDDDRSYRENEKVDYRNIVLRDRIDAEEVINELCRRIDTYGQATIADLFDLVDVTSSYVDNNWGWTSQNEIGIRRIGAGYLIDVDEAKYLD